jgi:hypothetical protein
MRQQVTIRPTINRRNLVSLWLPRSGLGSSRDAPASRQPTGRWSGQGCISTQSVGTRRAQKRKKNPVNPAKFC